METRLYAERCYKPACEHGLAHLADTKSKGKLVVQKSWINRICLCFTLTWYNTAVELVTDQIELPFRLWELFYGFAAITSHKKVPGT